MFGIVKCCVFFAVRTEFLNIINSNFVLRRGGDLEYYIMRKLVIETGKYFLTQCEKFWN
jgi:hypothetical protein